MTAVCPWCKYNSHGCDVDECDFKTLPYEKEAILKRLREEKRKVEAVRDTVSSVDMKSMSPETMHDLVEMIDRTKGMQIMVDRLIADFGMTNKEVYVAIGFEKSKMSWVNKTKLTMKLLQLKKKRKGGTDGSEKSGKVSRWPNRRA